jgi:Skp family chaperone for outer membrane proteins
MIMVILCSVPVLAQEGGLSIGVFDSSIVFDKSQHGELLKVEIERLRDRAVKDISGQQQQLEKLQEEFRNKELSFNDDKRSEMLQSINQIQIDLKRMNDDAQRALQAEFNRAQQKLQTELIQVVESLGGDGAYTLILEKGLTLYAAESVDITQEVLVRFDQMYPYPAAAGAP